MFDNLKKKLNTKIFIYDKERLEYRRIGWMKKIIALSSVAGAILLAYALGIASATVSIKKSDCDDVSYAHNMDLYPEDLEAWEDSVFNDYKIRADLWLSRPTFQGTPLTGDILALAARNAYDSTGIILPVELALTQAQLESSMGRSGKSPKNNPYNVGEHDSGTVKWFKSTFEGTQAYFYYMCRNYLRCRTVEELFVNFVNCSGHRYASSPTYEQGVRNQYYVIKNWLHKNMSD